MLIARFSLSSTFLRVSDDLFACNSLTSSGTYYVVPYTTGCKFKIAELDTSAAKTLVSGGKLTKEAEVAIRELHNRYDVGLDSLLSQSEFGGLIKELTGKELVWSGLSEYSCC